MSLFKPYNKYEIEKIYLKCKQNPIVYTYDKNWTKKFIRKLANEFYQGRIKG